MKKGFTLIEMLVVIGIIAALIAASLGSFSAVRNSAEKARAQELVSNTATALTALFNDNGVWPRQLREGAKTGYGVLDQTAAYPLAANTKYMSLTTGKEVLAGNDRFGIVTPWATTLIKRRGMSASLGSKLGNGTTVSDNILYYALDLDGDGIITTKVGGDAVSVRATAIVWCIGKSGGNEGKPWPYKTGVRKKDDVYSWSYGQTLQVK